MAYDWIIGTELCSSIATQIRAEIPKEDLPYIFKDKPRQDFKYCSLYIDVLNFEQVKQMRNTYNRTVFIDCRLHPERDMENAQTWCRNMAERILAATARVMFKGRLIPCTISETYYLEKEQVHHIILVFPYRAMLLPGEVPPDIFMETLDEEITITEYGKE